MNPDDYKYYCDLRRYGSCRHAGYGLGFERMVMYLTGVNNIRDVELHPARWATQISDHTAQQTQAVPGNGTACVQISRENPRRLGSIAAGGSKSHLVNRNQQGAWKQCTPAWSGIDKARMLCIAAIDLAELSHTLAAGGKREGISAVITSVSP